ncbi:hypothetical protein EDC04DRAFT_2603076 [Pisolithus marmoratus]|nr:hypothetical protein EDC04DRAFT_2603076 [Pisolithus marmoratus]
MCYPCHCYTSKYHQTRFDIVWTVDTRSLALDINKYSLTPLYYTKRHRYFQPSLLGCEIITSDQADSNCPVASQARTASCDDSAGIAFASTEMPGINFLVIQVNTSTDDSSDQGSNEEREECEAHG